MRGRRVRLTGMMAATAALAAACISAGQDADRLPQPEPSPPRVLAAQDPAEDLGERPNIVLITLDDLAGGDLAVMPRTRRLLADEGTTLTQGLAPTPMCAPARASLLTGQYAHNHGVVTVQGEGGGFAAFDDRRTLPTWLRRAGYDTMFAGKYLNGYGEQDPRYIPPGWNRWRASVDPSTYSFYGTRFNVDGTVVRPPGYSTDVLARYSEELLTQHRRGSQRADPFFMWVNYVAPHHGGSRESDDPDQHWAGGRQLQTTMPAARHRDMFADAALPQGPAMWETDLRLNRHAGAPTSTAYQVGMREVHQQRLESLQAVDQAVGRTVAALRRSGELERTVILLTSDNGFMVGQHNLFGKLWFYDDSLRIPIILRGPGIPRGRHVATPVTNPDMAVTIAAIAHARPTRSVDGVDVSQALTRPTQQRVVPIEAYPVQGGRQRIYTGVRYGDYTYVRFRTGFEELYDRARDPGELVNVARLPGYRRTLVRLRALDSRFRDCSGRSCPRAFEAAL